MGTMDRDSVGGLTRLGAFSYPAPLDLPPQSGRASLNSCRASHLAEGSSYRPWGHSDIAAVLASRAPRLEPVGLGFTNL